MAPRRRRQSTGSSRSYAATTFDLRWINPCRQSESSSPAARLWEKSPYARGSQQAAGELPEGDLKAS